MISRLILLHCIIKAQPKQLNPNQFATRNRYFLHCINSQSDLPDNVYSLLLISYGPLENALHIYFLGFICLRM